MIEDYGPPLSVIVLRKVLTPNSISKTSTTEINTNLVKIEDRLKLSSKKRKRLRKLLFPLNKELLKMNIKKPQNLIVNSLPDQEKQIVALGKKVLHLNKNLINDKKIHHNCKYFQILEILLHLPIHQTI